MLSNLQELEGYVSQIRNMTKAHRGARDSCLGLARAILGSENVVEVDGQVSLGLLERTSRGHRIRLRAGMSNHRRELVIGHELAHWLFDRIGRQRDEERVCDYIGAALVLPMWPFLELVNDGMSFADIADEFRTTESTVALRYGELTRFSVAVVTPERIHVRGEIPEPPEELLGRSRPWLRKVPLTDANRVALVIDPRAA